MIKHAPDCWDRCCCGCWQNGGRKEAAPRRAVDRAELWARLDAEPIKAASPDPVDAIRETCVVPVGARGIVTSLPTPGPTADRGTAVLDAAHRAGLLQPYPPGEGPAPLHIRDCTTPAERPRRRRWWWPL